MKEYRSRRILEPTIDQKIKLWRTLQKAMKKKRGINMNRKRCKDCFYYTYWVKGLDSKADELYFSNPFTDPRIGFWCAKSSLDVKPGQFACNYFEGRSSLS